MNIKPPPLVWMDLEMTGLNPQQHRIIEIATVISNNDLKIIAEGPVLCVHQEEATLRAMDQWNRKTHRASGLWERVLESTLSEAEVEAQTLAFIREHVEEKSAPLCGNTICQDRRFLYQYMPRITDYLHYRSIDVSSIKELAMRWYEKDDVLFCKRNTHRALDDIRESIAELKHYRECLFK